MTTHSNTPAGWYPDPQGAPQLLRWWDGSQWTQHTNSDQQGGGQAAQAQQVPQQVAQQAQPAQPQPAHQQAQAAYGQPQAQFGQQQGQGQFAQQAPQQGQFAQQAQQQAPQQGHYGHPQQVAPQADPAKVQRQVQQQAGVAPTSQGGGTLFTEPVLVVNQKAKLIELTNEYSVMDQAGNTLGSVVQVGQSTLKKVARFVSSVDQFMTHKLEIRDAYGQPVLHLTRPRKFMKSRVIVERADGQPIGEIVQQNMIGKINFAIMVNGQQAGAIKAENWRAWNFSIVDHADNEVARITKTWEGLAKTMFTTADNYVLQIHYQLPEPLLSLVVATALTVDTALKQDSRGFG
ncbi:phospholipid scramblase-related protein [Streptomyces sp. NBC_01283]|uniref:phospholipid scramblase-related protein n=1 Tax=Streptomyces sp. NBC_01283 TaxID=2903812 RepID=UPI00352BFF87|nr:phospholipid scramblase-related protein [Streptomyces sp. NBC_01283]